MGELLGWHDAEPGARCAGSTYKGNWLSIHIHNIHGLEPDEWFMTCHSLRLDTVPLKAKTLTEAKVEGWRLAKNMCVRYRKELATAWLGLPEAPGHTPSPPPPPPSCRCAGPDFDPDTPCTVPGHDKEDMIRRSSQDQGGG